VSGNPAWGSVSCDKEMTFFKHDEKDAWSTKTLVYMTILFSIMHHMRQWRRPSNWRRMRYSASKQSMATSWTGFFSSQQRGTTNPSSSLIDSMWPFCFCTKTRPPFFGILCAQTFSYHPLCLFSIKGSKTLLFCKSFPHILLWHFCFHRTCFRGPCNSLLLKPC